MAKRSFSPRHWVQLGFSLGTNGYFPGFAKGKIYTGSSKAVCVPGLSCYSCPGALGACPLGSLQNALAGRGNRFPFYVVGFFLVFGAILGRFICGWLCPFGLIQDLLYKIPLGKKRKSLPGNRWLKYLKYVLLAVLVILLPLLWVDFTGLGRPWFCKLVCPAGTLMGGIPLVLADPTLRSAIGGLFAWKAFLLAGIVILSIRVFRPFCRYLCPLGAIYGLFNPLALYRIRLNEDRCVQCSACQKACPLDLQPWKHPNSPDCIRCGACVAACPHQALQMGFRQKKTSQTVL